MSPHLSPKNLTVQTVTDEPDSAPVDSSPTEGMTRVQSLMRIHRLAALGQAPLAFRIRILRQLCRLMPENQQLFSDLSDWELTRLHEINLELNLYVKRVATRHIKRLVKELNVSRWTLATRDHRLNLKSLHKKVSFIIKNHLRKLDREVSKSSNNFDIERTQLLRTKVRNLLLLLPEHKASQYHVSFDSKFSWIAAYESFEEDAPALLPLDDNCEVV